MKKILILISILTLTFSGQCFASPDSAESGLDNSTILSSDSNQVVKLESVIENNADLASFIPKGVMISGLYEDEKNDRLCPFCWSFIFFFLTILIIYGIYLKKAKIEKENWFAMPVMLSVFIYLIHGFIHLNLASDIFLQYYWMILFDVLIFSYLILKPRSMHLVKVKKKARTR